MRLLFLRGIEYFGDVVLFTSPCGLSHVPWPALGLSPMNIPAGFLPSRRPVLPQGPPLGMGVVPIPDKPAPIITRMGDKNGEQMGMGRVHINRVRVRVRVRVWASLGLSNRSGRVGFVFGTKLNGLKIPRPEPDPDLFNNGFKNLTWTHLIFKRVDLILTW